MINHFNPSTTLAQLKTWLRAKADDGATCPLCEQHVQVYRRKINSGMARSLIAMYAAGEREDLEWVHLPTQIGARSREEGKLAYWDLIEEERVRRPDGGRAGYWRVTLLGELFVLDKLKVPKYARVYNGRVLTLDPTERISIQDALGDKFSYSDLMAGL